MVNNHKLQKYEDGEEKKMNKLITILLLGSVIGTFSDYGYNGSTTASVTIVGGVIKAKHIDNVKKYKRKNCPICKGKGWYLSGDQIEKVPCGYCEPEIQNSEESVTHPPVVLKPDCKTRVIKK